MSITAYKVEAVGHDRTGKDFGYVNICLLYTSWISRNGDLRCLDLKAAAVDQVCRIQDNPRTKLLAAVFLDVRTGQLKLSERKV